MEITPNLNQVDFEIAVNSFHDELFTKLEYINTVEIQLLRKFECNINLPETHSELIFYLRNMIQLIEEAFKDIESYFDDLKMNFLYDYFRKVQMLMINGYNFLSQALIIQIDQNEKEKEHKAKSKEMEKLIVKTKAFQPPVKTLKEHAKEIEHYDYAINYYENEETKITEELHRMQDNILMSKGLIDKLHPSKAVQELEEIKERAELTLENTEKIFEETYQLKYLEFKQYLSKLQKPEDFTKDFCNNLRSSMRDKFETGMKNSIHQLVLIRKEEQLSRHREAETQTEEVEASVQKSEKRGNSNAGSLPKNGEKLQNLLVKERKVNERLVTELQMARNEIDVLTAEKYRLDYLSKECEAKYMEYFTNYNILSKIYDEKREEMSLLKKTIGESNVIIDRLKNYEYKYYREFSVIDNSAQTGEWREFREAGTEANMQDNEIIVILKKTNERMGERIREKEIRIKQIEKKYLSEKQERISRLRITPLVPQDDEPPRKRQEPRKSITGAASRLKESKSSTPFSSQAEIPSKRYSKIQRSSQFSNLSAKRISVLVSGLKQVDSHDYGVQVNFAHELTADRSDQSESARRPSLVKRPSVVSKSFKRNTSIQIANLRSEEKRQTKKLATLIRQRPSKREDWGGTEFRDKFSVTKREDLEDIREPTEEREQAGLFQNLNIESQQGKMALKKRSALSQQFMFNLKRRQKLNSEADEKNKTCFGEFFVSARKNDDKLETKNLICIDKMGMSKKSSKKYDKLSVNPKKSQILLTEWERKGKENLSKFYEAK